jgi:hypothetical protein
MAATSDRTGIVANRDLNAAIKFLAARGFYLILPPG